MDSTELLHRYFDDGLDEPLEDVLFERLAADADLRRAFGEHMRLQSLVGDDVKNITPPAHVTQAIFSGLGLPAPAFNPPADGAAGMHDAPAADSHPRAGARWLDIARRRFPILLTAVLASLFTASIFFVRDVVRERDELRERQKSVVTDAPEKGNVHPAAREEATRSTAAQTDAPSMSRGGSNHAAPPSASAERPLHASIADNIRMRSSYKSRSAAPRARSGAGNDAPPIRDGIGGTRESGIAAADVVSLHQRHAEEPTSRPAWEETDLARAADTRIIDMVPPASGSGSVLVDGRRRLFDLPLQGDLLSHLVFELRFLRGTSWPLVNLPHNSHDIFANMAISSLFKISDAHAIGIEYGRETFGQQFASTALLEGRELPGPVEIVNRPPVPWIAATYRRNRMLDWYGAVWKLSFPDYGLLGVAYPYARTFVGATNEGPLARLRLGFEMYPTDFTMLNIGVEGTLLRYSIEGAWYQTTKLGGTVGLAIGF